MKLTGPQLGQAERKRTELYHRLRQFMETHEFLVLPVSQVPPFDVKQPYITEINGIKMQTYIDWMKSCYYITVTGIQRFPCLVALRRRGCRSVSRSLAGIRMTGVLQLAHAFEQATVMQTRPPVAA